MPSPQFLPKAHIVASVKAAITRAGATEEQATKAPIGVVGALSCAKPPSNTLSSESRAVRQLAHDKDIVVADKGRATQDFTAMYRAYVLYADVEACLCQFLEKFFGSVIRQ